MSPVFSAHHITSVSDIGFSREEYSRFKYGSKPIARKFGKDLALNFILSEQYKMVISHNLPIVVLSSPYCFVPTATFAMKDYFMPAVNQSLINRGLDPMQECKIYRKYSYNSDYGNMDAEQRRKVISSDIFHVDASFLKDKFLLFIDDIKVSGAHQLRIEEMMDKFGLNNPHLFVYYATTASYIHPVIENDLNYAAMRSLLDLNQIIRDDIFIFNTRNIKFILGSPHEECVNFLNYQKIVFVETLYHYAISNGYHRLPEFTKNFNYLKTLV